MQYSRCGNVWRNSGKQDCVNRYIEKTCDTVPRQEVWRRNRDKGLPDNYVGLMLVQDYV